MCKNVLTSILDTLYLSECGSLVLERLMVWTYESIRTSDQVFAVLENAVSLFSLNLVFFFKKGGVQNYRKSIKMPL